MYQGSTSIFKVPSFWLHFIALLIMLAFAIFPAIIALKEKSKYKIPIIILTIPSIFLGILAIISYVMLVKDGMFANVTQRYNTKNKIFSLASIVIAILLMFLPFQTNDNKSGMEILFRGGINDITFYALLLAIGLISCFIINKIAIRSIIVMTIPLLTTNLFVPIIGRITSYAVGLVLTLVVLSPMYIIAVMPFFQKKRRTAQNQPPNNISSDKL